VQDVAAATGRLPAAPSARAPGARCGLVSYGAVTCSDASTSLAACRSTSVGRESKRRGSSVGPPATRRPTGLDPATLTRVTSFVTRSVWSSTSRCATSPPRSWPTTKKRPWRCRGDHRPGPGAGCCSVRRRISLLSRSSDLFLQSCRQCSFGKPMKAAGRPLPRPRGRGFGEACLELVDDPAVLLVHGLRRAERRSLEPQSVSARRAAAERERHRFTPTARLVLLQQRHVVHPTAERQ
jgi:hypothetical protein